MKVYPDQKGKDPTGAELRMMGAVDGKQREEIDEVKGREKREYFIYLVSNLSGLSC